MPPVVRFGCAIVGHLEQIAIGNGQELSRDGDKNFCGRTVVGKVMTGKPVAMVAGLSE